jgi:hypothetical protein
MRVGLHIKCPLFLPDFYRKWKTSTNFSENSSVSNFIKIHSAALELLHADKGTDIKQKKTPWLLVRKRTIQTERPPLVGEVNANICG